jgi:hypothetical protein
VHDRLRVEHERLEDRPIANVALDVLRFRIGVAGPRAGAMHLRLEVVEDGDRVVARHQCIDQMRADVAGAARDENVSNAHKNFTSLRMYGFTNLRLNDQFVNS